jgi:hypothetical protein
MMNLHMPGGLTRRERGSLAEKSTRGEQYERETAIEEIWVSS